MNFPILKIKITRPEQARSSPEDESSLLLKRRVISDDGKSPNTHQRYFADLLLLIFV
jgi:hypothetical protein